MNYFSERFAAEEIDLIFIIFLKIWEHVLRIVPENAVQIFGGGGTWKNKLGLAIPKSKVKLDPELTAIGTSRISTRQRHDPLVILKRSDGPRR